MRRHFYFLILAILFVLPVSVSGENVTINTTSTINTELSNGMNLPLAWNTSSSLGYGTNLPLTWSTSPSLGYGMNLPLAWNTSSSLGYGISVPVLWNNTILNTGGNDTFKSLDCLFGYHVDFILKSLNVSVSKNVIDITVTVDKDGFSLQNPELVVYVNNTPVFNKTISSFPSTIKFTYFAMQRGTFQVKAVIDPDNKIKEYNEANNVKIWNARVTAQFIYEVVAKASVIVRVNGNDNGMISKFFNLFKFWPGGDIGAHFMKLDVDGALKSFFNNTTIPFLGVMVFLLIWGGGVVMAWAYSKEPEFVAIWALLLYFGFKEFITVKTYLMLIDSVVVPFAFIISIMYLKKIFDAFGGG